MQVLIYSKTPSRIEISNFVTYYVSALGHNTRIKITIYNYMYMRLKYYNTQIILNNMIVIIHC